MYVRDVMSANICCCTPQDDLEAVALMMMDNDVGSVPIANERGQPLGMITDRDIALAAAARHKALWELRAEDFVTGQPVSSCGVDDDIHTALSLMQQAQVHRLPVINGDGEILGMLSLDDIITYAERGVRGMGAPDLSYDDTVMTLKAVTRHH